VTAAAHPVRIGLALERGTPHVSHVGERLDFVEYGYHAATGIPDWVGTMARRQDAQCVLHPLDVNVGHAEPLDFDWLSALRRDSSALQARACVSDGFYWYHGSRLSTWPRPVDFTLSSKSAGQVALALQAATSIPFRVENPPVEWMPGCPDVWTYFDGVLAQGGVGLCLDLSHLVQFEWNVHQRCPILPESFAWEAVQEVHMSGYLAVQLRGHRLLIDQHDTVPGDDQFRLLAQVLERLPRSTVLDVCLEMEPHNVDEIDRNVRRLRAFLKESGRGA
jgi:uncharacterized protein (UPF0276 family)